ncbi:recombinase family protein [Streptomyces cyslabdanicus]|uniref:recombinase family protein n=1 Tax=Streptomyces cyslabdanicus TaxID=1470456 RepID=UPI004043FAFB
MLYLVTLGVDLRERGIGLHVVEQGIDTSTTEGRAVSGMMPVLAELRRELIVANTPTTGSPPHAPAAGSAGAGRSSPSTRPRLPNGSTTRASPATPWARTIRPGPWPSSAGRVRRWVDLRRRARRRLVHRRQPLRRAPGLLFLAGDWGDGPAWRPVVCGSPRSVGDAVSRRCAAATCPWTCVRR